MGLFFQRKQSVPAPDPTAVGAATCRLIEQSEPASQRLFDDPLVGSLLGTRAGMTGNAGMAVIARGQIEGTSPGLYGSLVCRARYIDDAVLAALGRGVAQVVIIGAGFDTRAYRLPGIDGARVVEFDLSATQDHKRHAIAARLGRIPEHVTYAQLDLESPNTATTLTDAGIVPTERAVVICEAVTQYVSAAAVDHLLAATSTLCAGSELIFTYVLESVLHESDGAAAASRSLMRGGPPWVFGLTPTRVPALLGKFGLSLIEDIGAEEYQERYLAPIGRHMTVSPYERIVRAVVA